MPLTLFAAPGACSRVSLTALAAAGLRADVRWLHLASGEQRQAAYLALNPRGKVPLLHTPAGPLADTLAIVTWLDAQVPEAGLLPPAEKAMARARALGWLGWAAGTLHPLVYRLRMSGRIHPDPATHEGVRAAALAELQQTLPVAALALAGAGPWLGGERWSIADTYVAWALGRAAMSGLDLSTSPEVAEFVERHARLPAWQAAITQEPAAA